MSFLQDFGLAPGHATSAMDHLKCRIQQIVRDIEASEVWTVVVSQSSPIDLVRATLREIYLEIAMYQPQSLEAAVAAIGQFPRTMPVAWFDEMLHHQVEEFDHGEMALRDYAAFGGDVPAARLRRQSPSAFAVAAVWRNIAHQRDPFAYLGAVYLFDALTPIVTERARDLLRGRFGEREEGLEFVIHHATADVEHERQLRELLLAMMDRYPERIESVLYGFEYFAQVYPLPGWSAALRRAELSAGQSRMAAE